MTAALSSPGSLVLLESRDRQCQKRQDAARLSGLGVTPERHDRVGREALDDNWFEADLGMREIGVTQCSNVVLPYGSPARDPECECRDAAMVTDCALSSRDL
jgi:hypothetical protein